jgi:hypothetical protein
MSREQFETKLEKDRAKETFVETRLKNLKARAEKFEDESPKMAAFAKLLEKLSGSSTDEQKIKKLEGQFEAIYANTEGYGKTTKKGNVIKGMTGKERVEAQGNTIKKSKDGGIVKLAKGGFPDLSGDGEVTQKDILMGKGVIKMKKGGIVKKKSSRTRIAKRGFGIAKRGY